jgi:hypothetical protein
VEQDQSDRAPDLTRLHALWSKTDSRRLGRKLLAYGALAQRATAIH